MRIQNLKASPDEAALTRGSMHTTAATAEDGAGTDHVSHSPPPPAGSHGHGDRASPTDRQSVEIALLKARIQHLELVIETARGLMGANQERLLRRLHEVPREMVDLSAQLRRLDPHAAV